MYYLYRHIRKDKNEPFYIGVGNGYINAKSYKSYYKRAFKKVYQQLKNIDFSDQINLNSQ